MTLNRNHTLVTVASAAALAITTACTEETIITPQAASRTPMTFSTYLPGHTRGFSSVADIQTLAESGFKLYATYDNGGTATTLLDEKFNVDATTGVCSSTSGEQPYWPSDKSATVSFIGMYPSNYFSADNLAKNVDDQYELKIETAGNKDVLVACVTQSESASQEGNVELTFKHVMTHAILKVSSADAADYAITLTQANLIYVPESSTLNCSTGAIVANADRKTSFFFIAEETSVTDEAVAVGSLMVPASDGTGTEVGLALTYQYNYGNDVVRTYKDTAYVTLVAGYQTNINVTVSGDKPLKVTGSLSNWTKLLDANGHDYVDLGLPSGRLWATCNIGALDPEDYGDYFAWGEKMGYTGAAAIFSWDSYEFGSGANITKYWTSTAYGTIDNRTALELVDDAACVILEGDWRIPTYDEWQELLDNCTSEWTTLNNVNGRLFTSNYNENTIFLPAAGNYTTSLVNGGRRCFYWSSTLVESNPICAWGLNASSSEISLSDSGERYLGRPIRAVMAP